MQGSDQRAGRGEMGVLLGRRLDRVRNRGVVVDGVRHAPGLVIVEPPLGAAGRPQVQRDQRVDLARALDRRDLTENALGLLDARAVVGLDALEVQLDQPGGSELTRHDGRLDVPDRGFLDLEAPGLRNAGRRWLRKEDSRQRESDPSKDRGTFRPTVVFDHGRGCSRKRMVGGGVAAGVPFLNMRTPRLCRGRCARRSS